MPAVPRRDKGVYVELPADLVAALANRVKQSGWTRKGEIILALRHWLTQPIVRNPTAEIAKRSRKKN